MSFNRVVSMLGVAGLSLCGLQARAQQYPFQPYQVQPTPAPPAQPAPAQPAPPTSPYQVQPFAVQPSAPQQPPQVSYGVQPPQPAPGPAVRWHIDGGYSDTVGSTANYLQGGWTAGGGFSIAPSPTSPFDLRFDASYSQNDATGTLLAANQSTNAAINAGRESIWSGTLDLEIHVPLSERVKFYVLGGGGAYNAHLSLRQPVAFQGYGYGYCNPFYYCGGPVYYGEQTVSSQTITKFGWNAGAGLEFALPYGNAWFVEGRFTHILPATPGGTPIEYVPITVGLKF